MRRLIKPVCLLVFILFFFGSFRSYVSAPLVDYLNRYIHIKYNKTISSILFVGANRQKMYLVKSNLLIASFDVSTSKYGCGQSKNSEKTPLGLHRIHSKTGKNIPIGGIISGPNYTGKIAEIENKPVSTGKDDITTRSIRLKGAETGVNMGGNNDSFSREIYIHGTPEEGLIGKPASHGCIRMRNKDIVDLFEMVDENMYVLILEN